MRNKEDQECFKWEDGEFSNRLKTVIDKNNTLKASYPQMSCGEIRDGATTPEKKIRFFGDHVDLYSVGD